MRLHGVFSLFVSQAPTFQRGYFPWFCIKALCNWKSSSSHLLHKQRNNLNKKTIISLRTCWDLVGKSHSHPQYHCVTCDVSVPAGHKISGRWHLHGHSFYWNPPLLVLPSFWLGIKPRMPGHIQRLWLMISLHSPASCPVKERDNYYMAMNAFGRHQQDIMKIILTGVSTCNRLWMMFIDRMHFDIWKRMKKNKKCI